MRLTDIVIRRTGLGSTGMPEEAALRGCADVASRELGWDSARTDEEIAAVRKFYVIGDA